ncbi:MAG: Asp-tRNA(Asn)/Glu-tRNA(Gln) amidotransferase subunit GatA [Chloroflexota bacterium]
MTDLTTLSLTAVLKKLNNGDITSVDITQAYLDVIAAHNDTINSYITVTGEDALAEAKAADDARANGETKPLLGVPLAIKDVISTDGVQTTCGSKILEGYKPIFDATAVEKLKGAGMVMLGKLNCDEFAMGSTNETSAYGICRNPWDTDRVPGGSSGGSAAAVAGNMCAGSLGTDTGGSVRLPGSFCNVTALKPSYGRVSRYGLIAYGSSLDSIGPIGRSVEDVAHMLQAIAGHDPLDSTSMPEPVPDYPETIKGDVKGLRVGIPSEYFGEGMNPEVEEVVRAAIAKFEELGAEIVEISLPNSKYSLAAYYLIATSEASSNLARFDGIRFGPKVDRGDVMETYKATRAQFGAEVKRRIMLGTYALSAGYFDAYYGKAQGVRTIIKREFEEAYKSVDVIMTAVSPNVAFKLGDVSDDPLEMYLADLLTVSANLAGTPALSVPAGFSSEGLPIGLQIMGPQFAEETILRAGYAYQQATDWHTRAVAYAS